jgi:hypothetical protein
MPQNSDTKELQKFLDEWPAAQAGLKNILSAYREGVLKLPGVVESFVARPGVSHSLRWDLARRPADRQRPLFALADVVPLGGDEMFLSVCFYDDEITDPQELGNAVPQGLFQETGYCFDLEEDDEELLAYCLARAAEAHGATVGD